MFQTSAKVDPAPYNGIPTITPTANVVTQGPNAQPIAGSFPGQEGKSFAVGVLEAGDRWSMAYSFLLPCCAMASARGYLDGSDCCLNMTHLNPILLRWITRSAYNISGSPLEDIIYGMFLPCCTINQVLQTTRHYGRPFPGTGREANGLPFVSQNSNDCCANCLYSTFCVPCAIGSTLKMSMGMPFYMGCLCSNYCVARSLLRYQYRLQGNDCWDDCCSPYAVFCGGCVLSIFCPCAEFIICPYIISMVMMMLGAAKERGNPDGLAANGSYLHPLPAAMVMSAMLPPMAGAQYSVPYAAAAPQAAVYTTATVQPAPMANYVTPMTTIPNTGIQMQPTMLSSQQQQPTVMMQSGPVMMMPGVGGGQMQAMSYPQQSPPMMMNPTPYPGATSYPYASAGVSSSPHSHGVNVSSQPH